MKLNTGIIIVKGMAFVAVGVGTSLSTSLAQYVNTGEWPSRIAWWGVVIPSCAVAAANAILSFLSGSFAEYKAERSGNGISLPDPGQPKPTTP